MKAQKIGSWGGLSTQTDNVMAPEQFAGAVPDSRGALAYGNGRSYGDSCLNASGNVIYARNANRVLSFDAETGVLEAEAGILLAEIIDAVAPTGWFLPVVPGTQFVTLGGAIANDIHGKNHHRRGTFGCHVLEISLDRSDRGNMVLSRGRNTDLFNATIGGLGLTGLIRKASVQLMPVHSLMIRQVTTRFDRLETYFEIADAADQRHEYAVAWIDSLSKGKHFGRGHLIAGDHAEDPAQYRAAKGALFSVPFRPPVSPLQGPFLKLFNEAYYRGSPAGTAEADVAYDKFFFPLDRVGHWNRLYGPRGLHQHQCVLPVQGAMETVRALIECTHKAGQGSFLTVLKKFGAVSSPGFMSFPREGYTLTLDFPDKGARSLDLLNRLDEITLEAGGAVNPYKDRRMSAQTFAASFPKWRELQAHRDPALISDFWRRTAMQLL